jgi:hypothetical protein
MFWTFALVLAFVSGYATSAAASRYRQRYLERERVVNALAGGAVPDWERVALKHEAAALEEAKAGSLIIASEFLDKAQAVRALGVRVQRRG